MGDVLCLTTARCLNFLSFLESAQAGLSWLTVLREARGYRRAFHDFDVGARGFNDRCRRRGGYAIRRIGAESPENKICNHQCAPVLLPYAEFGSFLDYIRSFPFPDGAPVVHEYSRLEEFARCFSRIRCYESRRPYYENEGLNFSAPLYAGAYLQATGLSTTILPHAGIVPAVGDRLTVDDELHRYVESVIIPRYSAFDKAHREEHVRWVIEQSLELASHYPSVDMDMVYIIAAFHDLGLVNGRGESPSRLA